MNDWRTETTRSKAWACLAGGAALCVSLACGSDDEAGSLGADAAPVIENYATIVYAGYSDALTEAEDLSTALDAFVAAPSTATLTTARQAWLAARDPYGQTEAYRFYDGPIDNPEDGPEGQLNAWPLDELYIDYVQGDATSGIINETTQFPTLSKELLADQNEQGGETNIATGYHAVEFLLWGQDLSATGPGNRPFSDYVSGATGTAANQARRGEYVTLTAELLVDDLGVVRDAWDPAGTTNYRADFQALDAREAVRRILQGMGSLAGAELAGERMTVAVDNRDQEDEHSCFSDNTHKDLYANALAIQNVYLGRYAGADGPGIDVLVQARDAALDTKFKGQLEASIAAVQAIPVPFDQALLNDAGRDLVMEAVTALQDETDTIVEIATLLGITLNLE
jgi:putative iron-regulated protein